LNVRYRSVWIALGLVAVAFVASVVFATVDA
jgi:hypothetical protein